ETETCRRCTKARGTEHPASHSYLIKNSDKDDELSIPGCSVMLADGNYNPPVDVVAYATRIPIETSWQGSRVPMLIFKGVQIEVFVVKSHPLFRTYRVRAELVIAGEMAQYLFENNRRLLSQGNSGVHSVSNLTWLILQRRWSDTLEDSADDIKEDIRQL